MPTKRKRRHPPRRNIDTLDPLAELLEEGAKLRQTFAARLEWSQRHPHPVYPALMPTIEEWRRRRWGRAVGPNGF